MSRLLRALARRLDRWLLDPPALGVWSSASYETDSP